MTSAGAWIEGSHGLRAAIEWRLHIFSGDDSLTRSGLELEPRWRTPAELGKAWLDVEVNAGSLSWQWPRNGADRAEYTGANGQQGVIRRPSLGSRGSLPWSSVGAGVELTLRSEGSATATLYVARPRVSAADFTVETRVGALQVRGAWPANAPLPQLVLHRRNADGEIDRRALKKSFEYTGRQQIAVTVSPLPGSRILAVLGAAGELIYWCRLNERSQSLGQPTEAWPLVQSLYVSQHAVAQTLWPRQTRTRLATVAKQLAAGAHQVLSQHLAGQPGPNLARGYRVAVLEFFGITVDRDAAALDAQDFASVLSRLLPGLDLSTWQLSDILWALRHRGNDHWAAVVKEYGSDPARMGRALGIWDELQRARSLLERSPNSDEIRQYIEKIERHITEGTPPPEGATLRIWRAENWFGRLHRLLLWWKRGSEPQEASGARDELQRLLETIERPPRVEESAADPALALAAKELAADDSADSQDGLTLLALSRLQEDVIPAAEHCARFHAYIHSVEQRTASFAWLAGIYPIDSERSMAERHRNAIARFAAIAGAEKEANHLVALRNALQDELMLEVLTTPAHRAVERVVVLTRARLNEVRDLLVAGDVDLAWPFATSGGSSPTLQSWWAALKQLESSLRATDAEMQRLKMIGRSVWVSLKPHLEQAKTLGFSPPEIEALAVRCAGGDVHAPKRLCERLAAMPEWSNSLEQGLVATRRKRGRR